MTDTSSFARDVLAAFGDTDEPARQQVATAVDEVRELQMTDEQIENRQAHRNLMDEVKKEAESQPTGAEAWPRLLRSFPRPGQGQEQFLEKTFGGPTDDNPLGNVIWDEDGTPFVRKSKDAAWQYLDKPGPGGWLDILKAHGASLVAAPFGGPLAMLVAAGHTKGETAGDVADLTRDIAVAAPGAAVGLATGGIGGAAAAAGVDAASEAVAQGVGAALPGEEGATLGERGLDVALAGGSGLALEGAGRGVKTVVGKFGPKAMARKVLLGDLTPALRNEAQRLSKKTGAVFTPGAATGSRKLLRMEKYLRNVPGAEDIWQAHDARNINAVWKWADENLSRMFGRRTSPITTGRKAERVLDRLQDSIRSKRGTAWTDGMDEADAVVGGQRVVPVRGMVEKVNALIDAHAGDAAVVANLRREGDRLARTYGNDQGVMFMSPRELSNEITRLGRRGTLFAPGARDTEKAMRNAVRGQLFDELDTAARAGGELGNAAKKVREVRATYREMSKPINDIENNTLLQHVFQLSESNALEALPQKILGGSYTPEQIGQAVSILESAGAHGQFAVKKLRRSVWDRALSKSKPGEATEAAVAGEPLSTARLAGVLGDTDAMARLGALQGEAPGARQFYRDIHRAAQMEAVSRRAGEGSQTGFLRMADTLVNAIKNIPVSPGESAVALSATVFKRRLAAAMTSSDVQKSIMRLLDTPPAHGAQFAIKLTSQAQAAALRDELLHGERQ